MRGENEKSNIQSQNDDKQTEWKVDKSYKMKWNGSKKVDLGK